MANSIPVNGHRLDYLSEQEQIPLKEAGMDRTPVPASPFSSCVSALQASINSRDQFPMGLFVGAGVEYQFFGGQPYLYRNFPPGFPPVDECFQSLGGLVFVRADRIDFQFLGGSVFARGDGTCA